MRTSGLAPPEGAGGLRLWNRTGVWADLRGVLDEAERETEQEAVAVEPAPAAGSAVPLGVEWFCYHAVEEKLLEQDVCVCLYTCLQGVSDLLSFAQSIVAARVTEDFAGIQELVEKSRKDAESGNLPPFSVFASS